MKIVTQLLLVFCVLTNAVCFNTESKEKNLFEDGNFLCVDTVQIESTIESTPYDNAVDYIAYWKNSEAMLNYQFHYSIDQRVILAKMWAETHGGTKGAGKRGANFGIKGKGIKGVDKKEYWSPKVEYQYYDYRWQSISHFCQFIKRPLYENRFQRWKETYPDWQEWKLRLISLQVDPWLSKSKLAYASCGCKDGRKKSCYQKRKNHALKNIKFIEKYF